jgi:ADP-ribose pyrophosphatase YjhB (NUDIX family)
MNLLRKALYQGARAYWMLFKPLTLGVRVMMLRDDAVLLVRHSYQSRGWHFPGGLVERGESLEQAARREAFEEVGATLGPLVLVGVFSSFAEGKSDHVTVFACTEFALTPVSNPEIQEAALFPLAGLPDGVSPAIRRRIEAFVKGERALAYGMW